MKYSFKTYYEGKMVQEHWTGSKRRFLNNLRTINWQLGDVLVALKVSYRRGLNNQRKIVSFCNEGIYDNPTDLMNALSAFTELEP